MDLLNILKITAKSSPIPTIVAVIVYMVYPKVIESSPSDTVLMFVSGLIFLVILSLLVYGSYKKEINVDIPDQEASGNEIKDVETENGDVFIGEKGDGNSNFNDVSDNSIENASTKTGDIFIGRKK